MFDSDRVLTLAALYKLADGEPMSIQDIKRLIKVIATKPIQTSQVDPATLSGLQMELREAFAQYTQPPK
jgi:hypothetical protein